MAALTEGARENGYMYMDESLCWSPETTIALLITMQISDTKLEVLSLEEKMIYSGPQSRMCV